MTYRQAIDYLYDLQLFGLRFGLDNTRRLAALAGNPQDRLRFIHVAGTNGKGSTCAMLESIHRAAGRRVGLFTSPHLVRFGERIQVNRRLITELEVVRSVEVMQALLRDFPQDHPPTFFEVVVVMALRHFVEQKCELVIWETGMGGRLDATNIVTPLATVITNIDLDHQKWLGHTLEQIATEKAGIIKPGVPALTAAEAPEALGVIRATAAQLEAPLTVVTRKDADRMSLESGFELSLTGAHQRMNAALAVAAVQVLEDRLSVTPEALRTGLRTVRWPGRMQVVRAASGQVNVVDGAHNPAGAQALVAALQTEFNGRRPTLILGVLQDKDWPAICQVLVPVAETVCLVPVASARSAAPEELRSACAARYPGVPISICESLPDALHQTQAAPFRLITGSLYLVGEALELLGASPAPAQDERGLNEWQVKRV